MSLELEIDELRITFDGDIPEHRARAISRLAVEMLQEVVSQNLVQLRLAGAGRRLREVVAQPVNADLEHASTEELARRIANVLYGALVLELRT